MKSLDDILDRGLELCDTDEVDCSFTPEEIKRVHEIMVACHSTNIGRPTAQTLLAFAEAVADSRKEGRTEECEGQA